MKIEHRFSEMNRPINGLSSLGRVRTNRITYYFEYHGSAGNVHVNREENGLNAVTADTTTTSDR